MIRSEKGTKQVELSSKFLAGKMQQKYHGAIPLEANNKPLQNKSRSYDTIKAHLNSFWSTHVDSTDCI